ncbi:hypothetical protein ABZ070_28555 [Streptomyces sp. NPDC006283]|uniref:hypothetical protein n=1 Tax=Streptomyces sp. NPDC006283 TaxID=3156741 RepID=UPI0033A02D81
MGAQRSQGLLPAPGGNRHINFLGRYLFDIEDSGPGQGLRAFRDPDAVEDINDED